MIEDSCTEAPSARPCEEDESCVDAEATCCDALSRDSTEWKSDLLDGVTVVKGKFADGSPLLAIPNYARENRVGQNAPRAAASGSSGIDYSGGASVGTTGAGHGVSNSTSAPARSRSGRTPGSVVWMRAD